MFHNLAPNGASIHGRARQWTAGGEFRRARRFCSAKTAVADLTACKGECKAKFHGSEKLRVDATPDPVPAASRPQPASTLHIF
jgi:hypothetical protein